MGESHWIQPSHFGVDAAFAIKPPNKIIGIVNRGAREVAVVMLGEREEISRPMPIGQSIGAAEHAVVVFVMQFPPLVYLIVVLIALPCVGPDNGAVMDWGPRRLRKLSGRFI